MEKVRKAPFYYPALQEKGRNMSSETLLTMCVGAIIAYIWFLNICLNSKPAPKQKKERIL